MTDFTRDEIIDFIYAEARMLDEGRYDEWLALWLDDGHYWMPLDYKQDDPHLTTSLLYEDMFMLKLRVRRLKDARTYSQRPCVELLDNEAGRYQTNTSMHYVETRLDDQILLALTATHDLTRVDSALRIAGKRVELLNCDAAFGNIQLLP